MEETSWISDYDDDTRRETGEFGSFLEPGEEGDQELSAVHVDLILPGDLLESILAYLPIASIFRAGCVCKRWQAIVTSEGFLRTIAHVMPQEPWYFMFTSSDEQPAGHAYDPILREWYDIELPCIGNSNWLIASSCGIVCFMDNINRSELCVCNPITKSCRKLEEPPGLKSSAYCALAIAVNRESRSYTVAIVESEPVPENFFGYDISIHIYASENMTWVTPLTDVLMGWRGGDESVICDGVLYLMVNSIGVGPAESRQAVLGYKISNLCSEGTLTRHFIPVPCSLTCGRLMNLKEKLVMVGGIVKPDQPSLIKKIGIWVLNDSKWEEIAQMPHKFFKGFGGLEDVFVSCGANDIIYIQSYEACPLLMYDMNHKQWKWSQKCPVTKWCPLQIFSGFCFEPRLEIAP